MGGPGFLGVVVWILKLAVDGAFPGADPGLLGFPGGYPFGGHGLDLGIEAQAVPAQTVEVAVEGTLVPGEGEEAQGHGYAHVDADHAAVGQAGEFAPVMAALGEDGGAVGKGVGVHQGQALLEIADPFDAQDRAEYFLVAHGHARLDFVQDGGADEIAVLTPAPASVSSVRVAFSLTVQPISPAAISVTFTRFLPATANN